MGDHRQGTAGLPGSQLTRHPRAQAIDLGERRSPATSPPASANRGSSFWGILGTVLGGVAQGLAAVGGKNTPQYAATASAFNGGASATGGYASASGPAGGGRDTQPPVNQCITIERQGKNTIAVKNSCGFDISMVHCFPDISGASPMYHPPNPCSTYASGNPSANMVVRARSSNTEWAPPNDSNVRFIACRAENFGWPQNLHWDGRTLNGSCHYFADNSTRTPPRGTPAGVR